MAAYVERLNLKPEMLLMLGDNFYSKMEGGLKSPRWQTGFEDMYPASSFPGICPAVLGNHDYHDNAGGEQVQLAYARQGGSRWTMPAKWYREDLGGLAMFLFLDTNLRSVSATSKNKDGKVVEKNCLTADEETAQWSWLKEQLASKRGTYTIVVGHHPVDPTVRTVTPRSWWRSSRRSCKRRAFICISAAMTMTCSTWNWKA